MTERIQESGSRLITDFVSRPFLRFFGIEKRVEVGPREWLKGFTGFILQANESIKATLHDDEAWILAQGLDGEEIPETWDEVHGLMDLERQPQAS